jgi:hypothetical protein
VENITALWDIYDSKTGMLLQKGRIIDENHMPNKGQEIVGVGNWKRAVIEKFNKDKPRDNLTVYAVYVSRRL